MRAKHVGADESVRAADGAVDVALRRQVHDDVGCVRAKHPVHGLTIADIGLDEGVAWTVGNRLQRAQIGRVGQLVDVDDMRLRLTHEIAAHRRSNEPRASGDDNLHSLLFPGVLNCCPCLSRGRAMGQSTLVRALTNTWGKFLAP